jgi:hypothetical protein
LDHGRAFFCAETGTAVEAPVERVGEIAKSGSSFYHDGTTSTTNTSKRGFVVNVVSLW